MTGEVPLPGSEEREAAASEFRLAWSDPYNRLLLEQQRALAAPQVEHDRQVAEMRQQLAEVRRPGIWIDVARPEEGSPHPELAPFRMRAALDAAKVYVWDPLTEAAVKAQIQADADAARQAYYAEVAKTAAILDALPVTSRIYFGRDDSGE
jgi:hypothetical protein